MEPVGESTGFYETTENKNRVSQNVMQTVDYCHVFYLPEKFLGGTKVL